MSTQSPARSSTASSAAFPLSAVTALVAASGALPALWNLSQMEGLHRSAFVAAYFGLNLILPFGFGYWTTVVWKRATPVGVVLLAACAGVIEAMLEALVLTHVASGGEHLVVATEDYVAWLAAVCLFAAGGLYGIRRRRGVMRLTPEQAESRSRSDWMPFAVLLLQFVGTLASVYPVITHR